MCSFIGPFKALFKCVPGYVSLIDPLQSSIKGLQGQQCKDRTDELPSYFTQCKQKICSYLLLSPSLHHLALRVDALPVNSGLGGTLFIRHGSGCHVAGFLSFKPKEHQRNWLPCELATLAITAAVNYLALYIRESHLNLEILSDNKLRVEACNKFCQGYFPASTWISKFLSALKSFNVTVTHLKGSSDQSSGFASQHPNTCHNSCCQICDFAQSITESVVQSVAA